MKWASVELGDVADINPRLGTEQKPQLDDIVSFVPMASVSEKTLTIESPIDRSYSEVSKGFTPFIRNDIIIAKITPCFENGKMAYAKELPRVNGFGSTEFHVVRPSDLLNGDYLFHFLRQPRVRDDGKKNNERGCWAKTSSSRFLCQPGDSPSSPPRAEAYCSNTGCG